MGEREWAGDRELQAKITREILDRYKDVHPVNLAGVAETILCNLVKDLAGDAESALAALESVHGDMKETIIKGWAH